MAKITLDYEGRKYWYAVSFRFKKTSNSKMVIKFSDGTSMTITYNDICVAANDSQEALAKAKIKLKEEIALPPNEEVVWGEIRIINTNKNYKET